MTPLSEVEQQPYTFLLANESVGRTPTDTLSKNTSKKEPDVPWIVRFPCDLPLSSASGAKPASLEILLLESVPISGISAMSRATVRSATPLRG